MDKARKGQSTRKPPEPSDSHAEIDDWMGRVMPDLQPLVKRLGPITGGSSRWSPTTCRSISCSSEARTSARPHHSATPTRSRYVKLKELDELEQPELGKWIEEAGRVAGWAYPES